MSAAEAPVAGLPARVDAVLLDAGGVLLDLDYGYLRRLIEPRHPTADFDGLARSEALARRHVERTVREGGRVGNLWRDYFHALLGYAHVPESGHGAIIDALWEAHQRVGLWSVATEGAPGIVGQLREMGFRTAVVSNAEGQVERDLENAGFGGLFETVVDSTLVGVEKPDPAIFAIALERISLAAEQTIYLGDLPSVDVAGAQAAGIAPVLLDRHDLYPEAEVPRLRKLAELPELLRGQVSHFNIDER